MHARAVITTQYENMNDVQKREIVSRRSHLLKIILRVFAAH